MHQKLMWHFLFVSVLFFLSLGCKKTSTSPSTNSDSTNNPLTPIVIDPNFYTLTSTDSTLPTGEILLDMNSSTTGELFILDQRGSIVKEQSVGTSVDNFQKWIINGQTRYTYLHTDGVSTLDGNTGTELGYERICDSNLNVIDSVRLLSYGAIDASIQDKLDVHDFILLGDNHYICETYYEETPTNIPDSLNPAPGVKVAACIIQEVNNGQVVFQWDGTQYPELYASSVQNNTFNDTSLGVLDYMHMNSICIDSLDNNLIVSFRNLDEIIKINRQTGQIMWRIGGNNSDFPLSDNQVFLRQHYPRFVPGTRTLIFVDNGLTVVRPYSRILEFQLDETSKTITSFSAFNVPDMFIEFAGSVKKENGFYFIGGGEGNYAAEINYTTGNELLRINQKYPSYRALKY